MKHVDRSESNVSLLVVLGATGETHKEEAKKMIMYAVLGLILAMLGDTIMYFVQWFVSQAVVNKGDSLIVP